MKLILKLAFLSKSHYLADMVNKWIFSESRFFKKRTLHENLVTVSFEKNILKKLCAKSVTLFTFLRGIWFCQIVFGSWRFNRKVVFRRGFGPQRKY